MILNTVPLTLGFLATKSEDHKKTALGTVLGGSGLAALFNSPDMRCTLADLLVALADTIRAAPVD